MSFEQYLDRRVPELMLRDHLPGAAIAIIEDATPILIKTWGHADRAARRPTTRNTLFNVASISKAVTAWGLMKLVEQGRVDLENPVEQYLGGWRLPASPYDHDLITVRRLLSHTAGISTGGIKAVAASDPHFPTIAVLEGGLPPLDELQEAYCHAWGLDPASDRDPATVKFPPGEAFHYSNLGFTLLQLLIEEQSGLPFAAYMQTDVLDPLGMGAASFAPANLSGPPVATAYGANGAALPPYRHVALAAGGLYCNIDDLARFTCAELRSGQGVISPESIATLFERQCFAETHDGMAFDAALGHFRLEVGQHTFVHHTGGVLGWRSVYGLIPQSGHGFCALINSDGGNEFWIALIKAWAENL